MSSISEKNSEEAGSLPGQNNVKTGTESVFVSEEADEYGNEQTGIKVTYVLTKKEIYECLKAAGTIKTGGKPFIFMHSVFTAFAIAFLVYGKIVDRASFFFLAAIFISIIVVFGVFPVRINHIRADSSADGHEICVRIYPRHIEVGRGLNKLNIPLDGTAESAKVANMIVLIINDKDDPKGKKGSKMVILPLRCLDPVLLPDVQAAIFSGTKPRKVRI